jgi:predicted dehydrogenase
VIRLGLMSFAHVHAEAYVDNVRGMPDAQLVGAADDDRARGEHYATKLGVPSYPTYQDLLAQHLDGVIVCAENARHRVLVEMAARVGVSVLCEKPLATTLRDARAMIDACARASVTLMVAFPMRFSAPLLQARHAVDDGRVGKIACCIGTNQGQNPRRHRAWFVNKQLAGGGAVMDHTVHLVDVLRWYLRTEVTEVYAQTTELLPGGNGEVETGGLILLSLANGLFASIDCSWSRPAAYPTWGGLTLELIGDRGVLRVDAFRQNLVIYPERSPAIQWQPWGSDANQAMLAEFVSAIHEHRSPAVTGTDGYRALEVITAAYESARTGRPVRLSAADEHTTQA